MDSVVAEIEEDVNQQLPEKTLTLNAKVSCLLFVASNPITAEVMSSACDVELEEILATLDALKEEFTEEKYGYSLFQIGDAWQLRTSPSMQKTINKIIPARSKKLSRAAAETLSIIAYRQPVQRAEIEAIRGVDSMQTVKTLMDARLIRIVGREHTAGQPALYGTTDKFLEKFGMSDLSELPTVRELQELEEEPEEPVMLDLRSSSEEE